MEILLSWGRAQKISPVTPVVPTASLTELWGVRSSLTNWGGTPRLDHHPQARLGTLLIRVSAPQYSIHEEERALKVLPKIPGWGSQMMTLLCATDDTIIQVAKQVYWWEWTLAPIVLSHWQHDECMLAYRVHQVWWDPKEVEDASGAAQLCKLTPPLQNHEHRRPPNAHEKILWQDSVDHSSNIPNWGARADECGTKVPHQNTKGNPHHHPLVLQDLVLQASDCVSICEIWNYWPGPGNPGVGHSKVKPLPWLKKNPRSRSDLTSMKSWAVNLHCP